MPRQHTIMGKPVTLTIPPRRFLLLFGLIIFIISSFTFFTPRSVAELSDTAAERLPKLIPGVWNPFKLDAHRPPTQANSTNGEASWFSDWKWLNPFSSTVTLDDDRAVLPPLRPRVPVYTYYDSTVKKGDDVRAAEENLLLTWRRAWWAQGFRPVVLGTAEAMNNPLYEEMQKLKLEPVMEAEIARWLAWGNMGTGVLSNWLALPMAPYDDTLLSYLRRGEYPKLTRYEGLSGGLFAGEKSAIDEAIKKAFKNTELGNFKSLVDAVPRDMFKIDPEHEGIAFYDAATISERYRAIADKLLESTVDGLMILNELINSHLHNTWQNTFSSGIVVLNPYPKKLSALSERGMQIAANLTECSPSVLPASCPPNRPKCYPCVASHPMAITDCPVYRNISTVYTIATVPHPYTLVSMNGERDNLDVSYIRRETDRDLWMIGITKELLGTGMSGPARLVTFKEMVAGDYGASRSLWLVAEHEEPLHLDWRFGFAVPRAPTDRGKSETPVPGPERRPPAPKSAGLDLPETQLGPQRALFKKARGALKSRVRQLKVIRNAVEAWNLADTEAWKFVRAFAARRRMERLQWEEQEERYAGGEQRVQGRGEGRWFDWA